MQHPIPTLLDLNGCTYVIHRAPFCTAHFFLYVLPDHCLHLFSIYGCPPPDLLCGLAEACEQGRCRFIATVAAALAFAATAAAKAAPHRSVACGLSLLPTPPSRRYRPYAFVPYLLHWSNPITHSLPPARVRHRTRPSELSSFRTMCILLLILFLPFGGCHRPTYCAGFLQHVSTTAVASSPLSPLRSPSLPQLLPNPPDPGLSPAGRRCCRRHHRAAAAFKLNSSLATLEQHYHTFVAFS